MRILPDVENRLISVSGGASFVYDGDGNRVKKIENGETTIYVNKYYDKWNTIPTRHYYFGNREVAYNLCGFDTCVLQDHLMQQYLLEDQRYPL